MTKNYPTAIEHEKKLLSAMMLNGGEIIPNVAEKISAKDFYRPEHRRIFTAIVAAYNRGVPVDVLLVQDEIERIEAKITGAKVQLKYLLGLVDCEYSTARADSYVEVIKEKSELRKLIDLSEIISDKASKLDADADKIRAEFENILFDDEKDKSNKFSSVGDIVTEVYQRAVDLHNSRGLVGVTTGLIDLDKVINGLQKSNLILLAARPAMGKTALALNIATSVAREKKSVAFFSLEMSKAQLGTRLLSSASRVDSQKIFTGRLSENEFTQMIGGIDEIGKLQMFIDDTSGLTVAALRSKALKIKRESGLDLIVVDYLQLMQGTGSRIEQNRVQEVSAISRGLKLLAKEFDVPVLALSQLSRNVEMRAEKKPQLSDLRESGSLEQDADIVMFLYRDEYYNRDEPDNENIAELIVAKNRNGATNSIRLFFRKEILRFDNLTRERI